MPPEKSVDQEATVRSGHGTTDWFQIGKGAGFLGIGPLPAFWPFMVIL